ncbi:Flagellar biosynthetic protein FlhB [Gimesia maris]|jgi:flagellar biosynthetic protein FlhB|uniref:Flagellar biosynthetic protein FlhB n=1 Tax=Gimesia maris TaxID=122 RepID=A0A3D3R9K9_9PLAN|nr:flagellar biosynthesis protein FlhB [Gimesia maris]MAC51344.1 flagellar biosynthesis protein FlhB [Gimesia sp.]QDT78768.1 Flagellar biosynthetic protein FlhB [Gimesia maris]HCO25505.1 flagellar biosynthesis protein FlhB [Gimesia maris]|tara:strand:+ start:94048 stop:95127 length:1080 start_codon:yes stop_codon:yes gene_type:complete
MAENDTGEKTEQPTDRRRNEAREKGNIAKSTDLNAAGMMLATAAVLYFFAVRLSSDMKNLMEVSLTTPVWLRVDQPLLIERCESIIELFLEGTLVMMVVLFVSAVFLNIVQVGFMMTPDVLQLKWERLNPIEGAKRIISIRGLVKLGVSLGKISLLVLIAVWFSYLVFPSFLGLMGAPPETILRDIFNSTIELGLLLALALIILGGLDYAFQKWKHEKDLMMSKQEIREEMKSMDGDPLIRQRRREAHRKLAMSQELSKVESADVVITNPTHISIAIKYDPESMPAPVVVAKGAGEIAFQIRKIANEHGIPIIERKALARQMYRDVKTGQEIPFELYEVFVEIMAYVYSLTGKTMPDQR